MYYLSIGLLGDPEKSSHKISFGKRALTMVGILRFFDYSLPYSFL